MRLAKHRVNAVGVALVDEIARNIAYESILDIGVDLETEILIDEEASYSANDALGATFAVNDIVVNNLHIDVRLLDNENQVSISRSLVGTSYLNNGTLVVKMTDNFSYTVIAYISKDQWINADRNTNGINVSIEVNPNNSFDLASTINNIIAQHKITSLDSVKAPEISELTTFVANKQDLILARQRQIVESTLAHSEIWPNLSEIVNTWSKAKIGQILNSESNWNARIDKLAIFLTPSFKRLNKEAIKQIIAKLGEKYGGQPELPAFRKALLSQLTREELSLSLAGSMLTKASQFADEILSGRQTIDAIKDFVKNNIAIDLANSIKQKRQQANSFMQANAEELTSAFQQLALQPAYATHSQDPSEGIESINEALNLLEAGDLAENLKDLEEEIISF